MNNIERLVVGVPRGTIDRSTVDPRSLAQFEAITGIKKTRRTELTPSQMILAACKKIEPYVRDVVGVIVVTQSPDRLSPPMAVDVHRYFKLKPEAPAFDVNQSCDGFVYGLWLGSHVIRGKTLVVCVDKLRFEKSPTESLIFSDAVSIAIVNGTYSGVSFHTNGDGASVLYAMRDGEMVMDGGKVFDFVTGNVPGEILKHPQMDFLCQHQANLSMMKIVDKKAGYEGRSLRSIEEYGNQSMVSIPTALAYNEQFILGKTVLLTGYGAGFCCATTSVLWADKPISHIFEL